MPEAAPDFGIFIFAGLVGGMSGKTPGLQVRGWERSPFVLRFSCPTSHISMMEDSIY